MNEYGIQRQCVCGKFFNCTDGDYFCSGKCYHEYIEQCEGKDDESN